MKINASLNKGLKKRFVSVVILFNNRHGHEGTAATMA